MKRLIYLAVLLSAVFFTACEEEEEAYISVQNKVHNVKLQSIVWNDYQLAYSLLPGESSDEMLIIDYAENFPKSGIVEFYMTADGNRVYLETRKVYELNPNENLHIVISDSTEVHNPLME